MTVSHTYSLPQERSDDVSSKLGPESDYASESSADGFETAVMAATLNDTAKDFDHDSSLIKLVRMRRVNLVAMPAFSPGLLRLQENGRSHVSNK